MDPLLTQLVVGAYLFGAGTAGLFCSAIATWMCAHARAEVELRAAIAALQDEARRGSAA